jgi:hypothetical protein
LATTGSPWLAPNGWEGMPGEDDPEHPTPFHLDTLRRPIKLYSSYGTHKVADLHLEARASRHSRAWSWDVASAAATAARPMWQSLRGR